MIEYRGITKNFGDKTVLKDLNLSVRDGEIFAFLGPNGAGKTTTIKITSGLMRPTSGSVHVCGIDVVKDTMNAKTILSYVPDHPYLYEKLTGRELLIFAAKVYGIARKEFEPRIDSMVQTFEMGSYVDNLVETYSHGMKQRLAISVALIHNPKVLLLDEPLVGLDPVSARIFKGTLRQLAQQGTTVFMSTHILSIAHEIADRIGVLLNGELIVTGTYDEISRRWHGNGNIEDLFMKIINDPDSSKSADITDKTV